MSLQKLKFCCFLLVELLVFQGIVALKNFMDVYLSLRLTTYKILCQVIEKDELLTNICYRET